MINFLLNILAVVIWITILLNLDEYKEDKSSLRTIVSLFFLGMMVFIPTLFLYMILPVDRFGRSGFSDQFIQHVIFVGPIEEFSKFITFAFFSRALKTVKSPRDGILHAATVGLSFAALENLGYAYEYGTFNLLVRSVVCIAGHMTYAAFWGFFYAECIYGNRHPKLGDYAILFFAVIPAGVFHGMYNLFLNYGPGGMVMAFLTNLVLLGLAAVMYRALVKESPYTYFPLAQYPRAIPRLRTALVNFPDSYVLNQRLAFYYIYARYYREALGQLDRCLKLARRNSTLRALRAVLLFLSGDPVNGEEQIQSAVGPIKPPRKILKNKITMLFPRPVERGRILKLIDDTPYRKRGVR